MLLAPLAAAALLAASPAPKKIAVFDLEATGVEPTLAQTASLVLPTEVRQRNAGAQVISSADIQSMLGLEKQKAVLGCTASAECLADIGGALGVEELISGRIGRLGSTYVIELRRSDVRKPRVIASAVRRVRGEADAIIDAVSDAVAEIYRDPLAPAQPSAREQRPIAPVRSDPPGFLESRLAGGILTGVGVVALGLGGWGLASSLRTQSRYETQQSGTVYEATVTRAEADRALTVNRLSWGGVAVGAVAVGFGTWRLVKGPSAPAVAAVPVPGGAIVAAGGSF